MRSFWSDPYLWIHLAGVAVLPIALEVCLLGLAVGDPILPTGAEFLLIAAIGIVPILWMQLQRPFYIFSLLAVALKPEQLSTAQRKLLRLFKTVEVQILSVLTAGVLAVVLWRLYQLSSIATEAAAFLPQSRWLGLLIAAIAFLGCNLFLQVPVSVLRVMLASEAVVTGAELYPLDRILTDFSVFGLRVNQIVRLSDYPMEPAPAAPVPVPAPPIATVSVSTAAPDAATLNPTPSAAPAPAETAESAPAAEPVAAIETEPSPVVSPPEEVVADGAAVLAAEPEAVTAAAPQVETAETVVETVAEAAETAADVVTTADIAVPDLPAETAAVVPSVEPVEIPAEAIDRSARPDLIAPDDCSGNGVGQHSTNN